MRKFLSVVLAALTVWFATAPGAFAIPASVPVVAAPAVPAPAPGAVGLAIISDSTGSYNINSAWPEYDSRQGIEHSALSAVPAFRDDTFYDASITNGPLSSTTYGLLNATVGVTSGSSIVTVTQASHGATLVGGYAVFLDVPVVGGININERICRIATIPNSGVFTADCGLPATSTATVAGGFGSVALAQNRSANGGNTGINGGNFAIPAEHGEGMYDLVDPIAKAAAVRTTSGRAINQMANASTVVFRCCQNNINSGDDIRIAQVFHKATVQALLDLGKIVVVTTMPGSDYPRTEALPTNPISVTNGSTLCTVTDTDHRLQGGSGTNALGTNFTIAGLTAVNGTTCNGTFTAATYIDADHYSVTGTGTASGTGTGGGSSGTRTWNYNTATVTWGLGDARYARKFQLNNWIAATYGSRRQQRIYLADLRSALNTVGDYGGADKTLKRDSLHGNEKEGDLGGAILAQTLAQLIKNPSTPWFDYTTLGNVLADPYFQATADGTVSASVTGVIPHLWSGISSGSTVTAVVATTAGTLSSTSSTPGTVAIQVNSGANSGAAEYAGIRTLLCRYCTFSPTNALAIFNNNPLMRVTLSSSFAVLGGRVTISGATNPIGNINPNGTWTIAQVDATGTFWVDLAHDINGTATGFLPNTTLTSQGGSFSLTEDATNLMPTGQYGLLGYQMDIPACAMFRGARFFWQQQTQGGSANYTMHVWKPYDPGSRGWNITNGRTGVWAIGEPIKFADTTSAGGQRLNVELDIYMEQSSGASCTFKVRTPFLKPMTPATNMVDPETFWTGPNIVPLSANDNAQWKALAQAVIPGLRGAA